ncbi:polysaccharide deacetylase family sporulation protein PdaB [Bacillus ectoiniformans]|uniref:polysaccharide deacetylase family protein n=1 Tax=Bacillus ectoiniformans TaxID=1494429 RepID=UPI00195A9479|nr:polysaccharide deacetylase family protein [Bacillus ectoiniformans]MBM7647423.1 polysaccharide deacetylase family sporulation protein PdaB [Bacillus ectoiniformans]
MSRHYGIIHVNGNPIETEYWIQDGNVMVSVLFFKNTGAAVDVNLVQRMAYIYTDALFLGVYRSGEDGHFFLRHPDGLVQGSLRTPLVVKNGRLCVSLREIGKKLGMKIWTEDQLSIIHVCTNLCDDSNQDLYYNGTGAYKQIALSFDDGPDEEYTPKILDILKEKQVKATFFVVGQQVKWFPEMLCRIIDEGHEVGNHSFTHPEFSELTTSELIEEIDQTEQVIAQVSGCFPTVMRPPFGDVTANDIEVINDLGLKVVLWSVDTQDWKGLSKKRIIHKVMDQAMPGSIILQHSHNCMPLDGTVEALPVIIDRLSEQGYQFVTISEMMFLDE